MLFELFTHQTLVFKNMIDSIQEFKTVLFTIDKHGISINSIDAAHVSIVDIYLNASDFEKFTYTLDEALELSIPLNSLALIFKCAHPNDALSLSVDNPDTLKIKFEAQENKSEFELNLVECEHERVDLPPYDETTGKMLIDSQKFKKMVSQLLTMSDTCELSYTPSEISFSANGDIGKAVMTIKNNDDTEENAIQLRFSLKYLNQFSKAGILNNTLKLNIIEDWPLKMEYSCFTSSRVCFYLAPKIDDD